MSKTIFSALAKKLKDRTTWAGLSLIAGGLGIHFNPDNVAQVLEAVFELLGLLFVSTKSK